MGLSVDIDAANTVKSNILKNKSGEVLMEVNKGLTAAITYPQKNVLNGLPSQSVNENADEMAEREEGEISDVDVKDCADFEYEDISSEEENSLRRKIQALEARNLELEKIAFISAKSRDSYDVPYPEIPSYYHYGKFSDRPSINYPHLHPKKQTHILSENGLLEDRELEVTKVIVNDERTSSRHNKRSSRTSVKKVVPKLAPDRDDVDYRRDKSNNRTKRKYKNNSDSPDSSKCERRKERKRYSTQSRRSAYVCLTSSDDDCVEITSRVELQAALNVKMKHSEGSLLERKENVTKRTSSAASNRKSGESQSKNSDQKNNRTSYAKSKKASRENISTTKKTEYPWICVASKEVDNFLYELQEEKRLDYDYCQTKSADKPVVKSPEEGDEDDDEDDDETVSLEEQELRLIALKSAVLKKHEARKKRRLAMDERPYSPTDNILTPERISISDTEQNTNADVIDLEGQNMEISPAMSPSAMHTYSTNKHVECQAMDMDLAHSDDSRSPVFFYEEKLNNQIITDSITMQNHFNVELIHQHSLNQVNSTIITNLSTSESNNIDTTISGVTQMQTIESNNSEEDESALRALLIANLKTSVKTDLNNMKTPPNDQKSLITIKATTNHHEDVNADESLEADCLRSLLLSSIRNKKGFKVNIKSKPDQTSISTLNSTSECSISVEDVSTDAFSMPQLASNLKVALKRLQSKNKSAATQSDALNGISKTDSQAVIQLNKSDLLKPEKISSLKILTARLVESNTRPDSSTGLTSEIPERISLDSIDMDIVNNERIVTNKDGHIKIDQEQENSNMEPFAVSKLSISTNILTPANKMAMAKGSLKNDVRNEIAKMITTPNQTFQNNAIPEVLVGTTPNVTKIEESVSPVPAKNVSVIQHPTIIPTNQNSSSNEQSILCEPEVPPPEITDFAVTTGVTQKPIPSNASISPSSTVPANLKAQLVNTVAARKAPANSNLILCNQKSMKARQAAKKRNLKTSLSDDVITDAIENTVRSSIKKPAQGQSVNDLIQKQSSTNTFALQLFKTTVVKDQSSMKTISPLRKLTPKSSAKANATLLNNKPAMSIDKKQILPKTKTSSKVILVADTKPVQQLIISVNHSESSTDTDYEGDEEVASFNSSIVVDSMFDNTSPVSLAMGSPAIGSPAPDLLLPSESSTNPAIESCQLPEQESPASNEKGGTVSFAHKLDEYLKAVRATSSKLKPPIISKPQSSTEPVAANKTTVKKKLPVMAPTNPAQTPSAVRHLPLSSQVEYRRLINRMKMLEKQKEQRLLSVQKITDQKPPSPQTIVKKSSPTRSATVSKNASPILNKSSKPINTPINKFANESQNKSTLSLSVSSESSFTELPLRKLTVTLNHDQSRLIQTFPIVSEKESCEKSLAESNTIPGPKVALNTETGTAIDPLLKITSDSLLNLKEASTGNVNQENSLPQGQNVATPSLESIKDVNSREDLNTKLSFAKKQKLKSVEKALEEHSTKFVSELDTMHNLVSIILNEIEMEQNLEKQLLEMRTKYQQLQGQLQRQKSHMQGMLPEIDESRKKINSNRNVSAQLTQDCLTIGRGIFGSSYSIPTGSRDIIEAKIKTIASKTKTLKLAKNALPIQPIEEKCSETHDESEQISNRNLETEPSPPSIPTHGSEEIDSEKEMILITVRNEFAEQQSELNKSDPRRAIVATSTMAGEISPVAQQDDYKISKYRSPLEHMQVKTNENASERLSSQDAIVCPFELMGQCEDNYCTYKHLSSRTTIAEL